MDKEDVGTNLRTIIEGIRDRRKVVQKEIHIDVIRHFAFSIDGVRSRRIGLLVGLKVRVLIAIMEVNTRKVVLENLKALLMDVLIV